MVQAEETRPIAIRFNPAVIEHLKKIARQESARRDEDVTYSDLIREAVSRTYLIPEGQPGAPTEDEPKREKQQRTRGTAKGLVHMSADFDAPMPEFTEYL